MEMDRGAYISKCDNLNYYLLCICFSTLPNTPFPLPVNVIRQPCDRLTICPGRTPPANSKISVSVMDEWMDVISCC